ncbi:phosphatidylinositol-3-phosphatase [Martiniozyma asiatica (nom. inval.)]|nr:phosphatidylinositol-3-phosphatase [Martiniozyma asiatica]
MEYLKVTKVDDVVIYRRGQQYNGILHLTTHHLIFTITPTDSASKPQEMWFCYPMIDRVDFNRGSAMLFERGTLNSININNDSWDKGESLGSKLTSTLGDFLGAGANSLYKVADGVVDMELLSSSVIINPVLMEKSASTPAIEEDMANLSINSNGEEELKQRKYARGANIRLQLRDFNYIAFDFKNILRAADVFDSIMKLTCVESIDKFYAFIYQPVRIEKPFNGWDLYNISKEFQRQGLNLVENERTQFSNDSCLNWRLSKINKNFSVCDTYPKENIVPITISDTMLKHAIKYRSKNRFPTLSYYYAKNKCTITRCAQPLVGIKQNRSIQDEKLINEIFKSNGLEKMSNLIVDARPMTNAMAQTALGAGSEIIEHYGESVKKIYLNIENIHVMRDSITKVKDALKNTDVDGCKVLVNRELLLKSGWIDHIKNMLKGVELLTKWITLKGVHIVVHCSDGWDRTAQICSLVEICLDPYYRTIEGFCVLVEKEWCSFGHRFAERCGHMQKETKFFNHTEEGNFNKIKVLNQKFKHQQNLKFESPVFQQFLDCVYQLLIQFPKEFEYNERFLRRLVYHLYSCQYGTFLVDNEFEREQLKLTSRTRSVWDYFLSRRHEFSNGNYAPTAVSEVDPAAEILYPKYSEVVWWWQLFGKGQQEMN